MVINKFYDFTQSYLLCCFKSTKWISRVKQINSIKGKRLPSILLLFNISFQFIIIQYSLLFTANHRNIFNNVLFSEWNVSIGNTMLVSNKLNISFSIQQHFSYSFICDSSQSLKLFYCDVRNKRKFTNLPQNWWKNSHNGFLYLANNSINVDSL